MAGKKIDLDTRMARLEERLAELEERIDALEEVLEEPGELSEKDVMFENGEDKDDQPLGELEEE